MGKPRVKYPNCKFCGKPLKKHGQEQCGDCYNEHRQSLKGKPAVPDTASESFSSNGDSAETSRITDQKIRTLEDLIRVCEIDTDEWVVDKWVANKWEVGSKDPSGKVTTTPLYQVKAWLKRNRPMISAKAEIDALIADAKKLIAPRPFVQRKHAGPYLLEIAIPDLHLGKLAWGPETGGPNYDSKIAAALYMEALEALIQRTAAFKFERVVLVVGQDFYHSDSKQGTTTKGTPLDNDSRFHKTFIAGRRLMTEAIERLRTLAHVEVPVIPGNHDTMAAFHLGDSLECYYHNTKDVTIRNEPTPRKYVSYGRNLILYCHGDKGKRLDYPLLMATEQPELFGKALYREIHTGHTHELKIVERMGVRVRVSPALTAADAWHNENHFVGNLRQAEALVWSRDEGNVATATFTVNEEAARKAS